MSLYSRAIGFVKEALAPAQCAGCGEFGVWICEECEASIQSYGKEIEGYPYLDHVLVASEYEGTVKELIHTFKYEGVREVAPILTGLLARELNSEGWIVTCVPMHAKRQQERGFNQAEILAQQLAQRTGQTYMSLLTKKAATWPQTDLTRVERLDNLTDIFESQYSLWGSRIVIVDDVLTTGATLTECAKALKKAGAHEVQGLVIAKG